MSQGLHIASRPMLNSLTPLSSSSAVATRAPGHDTPKIQQPSPGAQIEVPVVPDTPSPMRGAPQRSESPELRYLTVAQATELIRVRI
jgi:hypothetical protein